ncbi:MAG: 50S ribosomal protein L15 [Porphyromonas sp.]|nr:50S ribosomal protein L15 [Bacteroidales bacterium]MDD7559338.1 50S ribosomal protein L15 [Bacteroidales bacterium]MDY3100053.1 50S ribosomal protein L15 [Porphyromonas sp.]
MNLSNLKPAEGSTHSRRRIGRGPGSGMGGTSTRGHKGAKSRSGYHKKFGFEGGQMPLQRRLPKFGFRNPNRVEYKPLNLVTLAEFAKAAGLQEVSFDDLVKSGRYHKDDLIKVLGNGLDAFDAKLTVHAHSFSASAKEAIEKAGGSAVVIETK